MTYPETPRNAAGDDTDTAAGSSGASHQIHLPNDDEHHGEGERHGGDQEDAPSSSAVRQGVRVRAATPTLPPRIAPHKTRWRVLGIALAILLVLGGIGAFAYSRFTQPAQAASAFCRDLQARGYTQAYALLTGTATDGLNATQFADAARALEGAEGTITACGQQTGAGAYGYVLGGSTATVGLTITRGKGTHLQGTLRLADVRGVWKITSASSGLFGVNLAALTTATSYCADLRAQNYGGAYALLGTGMHGQTSASDFAQQARDHDTLDGPVTACVIVGVARGNTDASATLTTRITRQRLGARDGSITLTPRGSTGTGAAWRVGHIDEAIQGSDLGGLQVTRRFCDDLGAGNYGDASGLFSTNLSGQMGNAAGSQAFLNGQDGLQWVGCVPQVPTYAVSGAGATLTIQLTLQAATSGQQGTGPAIVNLVREDAGWRIDNISFPSLRNP